MTRYVLALGVVLLQWAAPCRTAAQSVDDLRIVARVSVARADGGDRLSTMGYVDPSGGAKTTSWTFARLVGQCGSGVDFRPADELRVASDGTMKKVYSAWAVQMTPIERSNEAVTFRVQWVRARDNGKPSTVGDDVKLTLRPGQSMSLDVMAQSDELSEPPPGCVVRALSLEVAVQYHPVPDQDRRLIAIDLWLVERLPDGKELSQPLALRGLYNQPIPFYFETLTEGTWTLDIFGDLQVSPGDKSLEVKMTTKSRLLNPKAEQRPPGYPAGAPWPLAQYVGSKMTTLRLAPGEVVSVSLPSVGRGGADAEAFAPRALSYRIRARQMR